MSLLSYLLFNAMVSSLISSWAFCIQDCCCEQFLKTKCLCDSMDLILNSYSKSSVCILKKTVSIRWGKSRGEVRAGCVCSGKSIWGSCVQIWLWSNLLCDLGLGLENCSGRW